ncbi:hypothetical protein [Castellaniella sp.]|nr:hypothetical protein [Castellaniella sp.]
MDLESGLFTYQIHDQALALARAMDGKLLRVARPTPAEAFVNL